MNQWTKTFTGVAFLILGISILKIGSNLETSVSLILQGPFGQRTQ